MSTAYADKSQGFIFRIPVYSNMPESAVTFSDSGNPNNWLSSLSVSGYGLTPVFPGSSNRLFRDRWNRGKLDQCRCFGSCTESGSFRGGNLCIELWK